MAKPPVKAQQLADAIRDRIRSGDLRPGEWLPSERQLAEQHVVVRSTVRQAVKMLVDAGLVESVPGSGVRVGTQAVDGAQGSVVLDAASVHEDLAAIRQELSKVTARLTAIEQHTGLADSDSD